MKKLEMFLFITVLVGLLSAGVYFLSEVDKFGQELTISMTGGL